MNGRRPPNTGRARQVVLHSIYNDGWFVELLFPALVGWNDWSWRHRRSEGVLAAGETDGQVALISLGSDATVPPGQNAPHTLAAARYESGLDNSPMYDNPGGNYTLWDSTTQRMYGDRF